MFQKKLKYLLVIKTYKQILLEYKHMIQQWVDIFDFMLENKSLTDPTNLFSPNHFKRSDDMILNYF